MKRMKTSMLAGGMVLLVSACTTATKPVLPSAAFVAWSQEKAAAKRVCVLPFTDLTGTEGLAELVRESFSGHLSVKRFADAELHEIDASLDADWRNQPASQLGKTLGCDALVYGVVTKASRLYLGIYSQLTLEGAIRLVETTSGQPLVEESYTTRFHAGGIPFSPFGVVPSAVLNLRNMTDAQMVRAVDDMTRHLAQAVPDLPVAQPLPRASSTVPSAARAPSSRPGEYHSPPPPSQQYRVQVASFSTHQDAQEAARLLRDKGYHPAIAEFTDAEHSWHRVVLGPFPSAHEARDVGAQIEKILPFTPLVTHTP